MNVTDQKPTDCKWTNYRAILAILGFSTCLFLAGTIYFLVKCYNQNQIISEQLLEYKNQLNYNKHQPLLVDDNFERRMKKLFDELNKMMDKLDRNQVQEKLEELKLTNKDIEKELDRNLEAFKQLELEQKMQNAIEKLDALKQQEENLNKLTEGKKPENKDNGHRHIQGGNLVLELRERNVQVIHIRYFR